MRAHYLPQRHRLFAKHAGKGVEYTIGGYQIIKKWLNYREHDLLGHALTPDEAREVTSMARRIVALTLLQPELDKNYEAVEDRD
jgi:hypothetical protein